MEAKVIEFYLSLSQCQLRNKPAAIKAVMTALGCNRVVAEQAYVKLAMLKYMDYATLCGWFTQIMNVPAAMRMGIMYRFESQYGEKALNDFERMFRDLGISLTLENTGTDFEFTLK